MLVGIDESEQSFYALEWALDHFFTPFSPNFPFNIILVHAKPTPTSAIGFAGPGNVFFFILIFILQVFFFNFYLCVPFFWVFDFD